MRRTLARLLRGWADCLEPPALLPAMFVPPSEPPIAIDQWIELTPGEGPPLPQSVRNDLVLEIKPADTVLLRPDEDICWDCHFAGKGAVVKKGHIHGRPKR